MAKFSIYLRNHPSGSLVTIGDILQPLAAGLSAAHLYDELIAARDLRLKGDSVGFGIELQRRFRLEASQRAFLKAPLAVAGLPG